MNVGAVMSLTLMTCWNVSELPQVSAAFQVNVRVIWLVHVGLDSAESVCVGVVSVNAPSQLSVAVTVGTWISFVHSTEAVKEAVFKVNVGTRVSFAVMLCWSVLELPQVSVAVHVKVRFT